MKLTRIGAIVLAAAMLPSGVALAQDASPAPSAGATLTAVTGSIADAFPVEVGGVPLADSIEVLTGTEAAADDEGSGEALSAVAASLGVSLDDVSLASAFTFTDLDAENGVFIIAVQVPGMDPDTGMGLLLEILTYSADEDLVIGEAEVAGKGVVTLSSPDDPEAVAYLYAGGDIAWMVAAPLLTELEEAISQLP